MQCGTTLRVVYSWAQVYQLVRREALMRSLKSMLAENRVLVGLTVQHLCTNWLARVYKNTGTDFVYIEYEHSFMNEAELANFVLACRTEGLPVVAKVPECSRTHVAKLLECGVIGIQLP